MPAEKALDIMGTMHQSNGSITIIFKYFNLVTEKEETCFGAGHMAVVWNEIDREQPITINSINQIIPTYSIGDKVLILPTGEMAEVSMVVYDQFKGQEEKHGVYVIIGDTIKYYHRSQIAKLPNGL